VHLIEQSRVLLPTSPFSRRAYRNKRETCHLPRIKVTMNDINNAGITTITTSDITAVGNALDSLTTISTYAPSCGSQWLQHSPDAPYPDYLTYTSVSAFGTYWSACQPNGNSKFSPGVRPKDWIIATMTEYWQEDPRISSRVWAAWCCMR
jgi:hypothetical protein